MCELRARDTDSSSLCSYGNTLSNVWETGKERLLWKSQVCFILHILGTIF